MKAIVYTKYGPPEVLQIKEVEKPTPRENEVLIKIFAATGLRPPQERTKDLIFLKELMESGKIRPVIDKCYSLEQISEAHRYVDKGHKKGNVARTVEHNNKT